MTTRQAEAVALLAKSIVPEKGEKNRSKGQSSISAKRPDFWESS